MRKRPNSPIRGTNAKRPSTHLPTRKRRGSHLTLTGKFPSSKTKHLNPFEGLRERDFFVLLEYDPDVESFEPHPVRIPHKEGGRARIYTPDVLVTYRKGPDGKPVRRHELCEVKIRFQLRKDWVKFRGRFRAAQRYSRQHSWRFRIVDERTIIQPFMGTLHFLLGFRQFEPLPGLVASIRQCLTAGPLAVSALVPALEDAGYDAGDVLVQLWREVGAGAFRLDFERAIGMRSIVSLHPWTLRGVLHDLRTDAMARKRNGERIDVEPRKMATESIGSAGSDVAPIERGKTYGRLDRAGVYSVVQFEDPETVTVREHGAGTLETIPVERLSAFADRVSRGRPELNALTDKEREKAEKRYAAIAPFIERTRVSKVEAQAQAMLHDTTLKTWRSWLRAYRHNPTLTALMRRRRADAGNSRLDADVELLVTQHIERWLNSTDTIASVHAELEDAVKMRNRENPQAHLRCPNYTTFYKRCTKLPPHLVSEHRDGKRIARLTHGLRRGSLEAQYPLHIVQIDHTPVPVMVVDSELGISIGRPTITVLIDLFSHMVVGYYLTFDEPGNASVGMAISNAVLPKKELLTKYNITTPWPCSGCMRILHADNAGEFHGNMLELACKANSIELHLRKVKAPNYGGHIESYLGTLSEKMRSLPGATLGGPDELGDRDPRDEARMTLADLEAWFLLLLAEYHQSEHSALHGQSPIAKWRDGFRGSSTEPGIGKVFLPKDPEKFRIDFYPVEERTVGPKGIVWDYIWYSDEVLRPFVNARDPANKKLPRLFICRRDPRALDHIYFWDPDQSRYYRIGYRNASRPTMTLWEYNEIRKFLTEQGRREIDEDLIFSVRVERRRRVEESKTRTSELKRARENERRRLASDQLALTRTHASPPSETEPQALPVVKVDEEDIEPFEDFVP